MNKVKSHHYAVAIKWTGNQGTGTSHYKAYNRNHEICVPLKADILGSSDTAFLGDALRHNPEELLVASLSSCHMLWYLHLCAEAGVVVESYEDNAHGVMEERPDGSGRFVEVTLEPFVTVAVWSMKDKAMALHAQANQFCFIANSVNFPVKHLPVIQVAR